MDITFVGDYPIPIRLGGVQALGSEEFMLGAQQLNVNRMSGSIMNSCKAFRSVICDAPPADRGVIKGEVRPAQRTETVRNDGEAQ